MHLQTAVLTKVLRTHNRERTITSVNAAAKTVQLYRMKTDPCLSPDTNIRSKYMKGLNVGSQTAKLLEESMEACMKFHYIGLDYDGFGYDLAYTASFFGYEEIKAKIENGIISEFKKSIHSKGNNRVQREPTK